MFKRICLVALLSVALVLAVRPVPTEAAEFLAGPVVTVGAGEVVDDDVYASGGTIEVKGIINGDLVTAGGDINVEGTVNGDLIAAGGNINVTGPVRDNVRAAGGQIKISSTVGGDVIVGGGSVLVAGSVAGDLVVGSGNLNMIGTVDGDARIGGGDTNINGTIKGNVAAEAGQLTVGPKGRVEGDLDYASRREVQLETGAQVVGSISHTVPDTSILGRSVQDSWLVQIIKSLVSQLRWFLGIALVGLLLLWLIPRVVSGVAETPLRSPWKSLSLSVAVLIVAPIALLIVGVISIVVGGPAAVPVLLVPGALYLVLLSLAAPVIAVLVGALILRQSAGGEANYGWKALLIGAAVLAIIGLVPVLNVVATILIILFGFGAWTLYLYRNYTEGREARP